MMSSGAPVDVVVVEDRPDEVSRIRRWLLLDAMQTETELVGRPRQDEALDDSPTTSIVLRPPDLRSQADNLERNLHRQLERADPLVVIFDWLLSGELGDEPHSGFHLARVSKQQWPDLGVIVVTTGGDDDLTLIIKNQQELDEQVARMPADSRPDHAWIKPWGASGRLQQTQGQLPIDYRETLRRLLARSRRPSEHR